MYIYILILSLIKDIRIFAGQDGGRRRFEDNGGVVHLRPYQGYGFSDVADTHRYEQKNRHNYYVTYYILIYFNFK